MLITRKRFLTISGLTICSLAFASKSYAGPGDRYRWESNTTKGQYYFAPRELSGQVDFYKGNELNRIVINGATFGNGGPDYVGSLTLEPHGGEYINYLEVRGHDRIDLLLVKTNNGNVIAAGGNGGDHLLTLPNIKLWNIGGTYEGSIWSLILEYET